jgi:hypothetical protein
VKGAEKVRFWVHVSNDAEFLEAELTEDGQGVIHIEGCGAFVELWHPQAAELVKRLRELADDLERQISSGGVFWGGRKSGGENGSVARD